MTYTTQTLPEIVDTIMDEIDQQDAADVIALMDAWGALMREEVAEVCMSIQCEEMTAESVVDRLLANL